MKELRVEIWITLIPNPHRVERGALSQMASEPCALCEGSRQSSRVRKDCASLRHHVRALCFR